MSVVKKSGGLKSTVVCWGEACTGNFSAPVRAKSILIPVSECACRCLQELHAFFGHGAAANVNAAGQM
jgi:hypothetical protein